MYIQLCVIFIFFFFFFSSRRRHTRSLRDWSSDVCSSDLYTDREYDEVEATWKRQDGRLLTVQLSVRAVRNAERQVEYYETRSEERRVGKECRSRWWTYHEKKKNENETE